MAAVALRYQQPKKDDIFIPLPHRNYSTIQGREEEKSEYLKFP